jgi:hypothetical protein
MPDNGSRHAQERSSDERIVALSATRSEEKQQSPASGSERAAPDIELEAITVGTADFLLPDLAHWTAQTPEARKIFIATLAERYAELLTEFLEDANGSLRTSQRGQRYYRLFRISMLFIAACLAGANVSAASATDAPYHSELLWGAAILSIAMGAIANLETLYEPFKQMTANRETRDMYVDVYRSFRFKWYRFVEPFGESDRACVNAQHLVDEIVTADRIIRRKVRELTVQRAPVTK